MITLFLFRQFLAFLTDFRVSIKDIKNKLPQSDIKKSNYETFGEKDHMLPINQDLPANIRQLHNEYNSVLKDYEPSDAYRHIEITSQPKNNYSSYSTNGNNLVQPHNISRIASEQVFSRALPVDITAKPYPGVGVDHRSSPQGIFKTTVTSNLPSGMKRSFSTNALNNPTERSSMKVKIGRVNNMLDEQGKDIDKLLHQYLSPTRKRYESFAGSNTASVRPMTRNRTYVSEMSSNVSSKPPLFKKNPNPLSKNSFVSNVSERRKMYGLRNNQPGLDYSSINLPDHPNLRKEQFEFSNITNESEINDNMLELSKNLLEMAKNGLRDLRRVKNTYKGSPIKVRDQPDQIRLDMSTNVKRTLMDKGVDIDSDKYKQSPDYESPYKKALNSTAVGDTSFKKREFYIPGERSRNEFPAKKLEFDSESREISGVVPIKVDAQDAPQPENQDQEQQSDNINYQQDQAQQEQSYQQDPYQQDNSNQGPQIGFQSQQQDYGNNQGPQIGFQSQQQDYGNQGPQIGFQSQNPDVSVDPSYEGEKIDRNDPSHYPSITINNKTVEDQQPQTIDSAEKIFSSMQTPGPVSKADAPHSVVRPINNRETDRNFTQIDPKKVESQIIGPKPGLQHTTIIDRKNFNKDGDGANQPNQDTNSGYQGPGGYGTSSFNEYQNDSNQPRNNQSGYKNNSNSQAAYNNNFNNRRQYGDIEPVIEADIEESYPTKPSTSQPNSSGFQDSSSNNQTRTVTETRIENSGTGPENSHVTKTYTTTVQSSSNQQKQDDKPKYPWERRKFGSGSNNGSKDSSFVSRRYEASSSGYQPMGYGNTRDVTTTITNNNSGANPNAGGGAENDYSYNYSRKIVSNNNGGGENSYGTGGLPGSNGSNNVQRTEKKTIRTEM